MAYQDRGSSPPHFDGKNYPNWVTRMGVFLRGKAKMLWDATMKFMSHLPTWMLLEQGTSSRLMQKQLIIFFELCPVMTLTVCWARTSLARFGAS